MMDQFGREIRYLRVSVTDRCNHRCRYCLPAAGARLLPHEEILRYEEILAFAAVAAREGIDKLRVTGGEPLLRRGIVSFMERLVATSGLDDVLMTTNGTFLPRFAAELRAAGLKRINIGIPSLHPDTLMELKDRILLRKRSVIETVNDELKNICQIEHSRHRSFTNFITNLLAGIAAYCFFPKKPAIHFDVENSNQLVLF